jgi:hypothetical protein
MEYGCELIGSIVVASEGKLVMDNIFLISKLGKNHSLFFILHFYIVLANYKYLPEEKGKGDFSLRLYLHLRVTDR